jgi:hypothetical protein
VSSQDIRGSENDRPNQLGRVVAGLGDSDENATRVRIAVVFDQTVNRCPTAGLQRAASLRQRNLAR